jgi:hypothetical protein
VLLKFIADQYNNNYVSIISIHAEIKHRDTDIAIIACVERETITIVRVLTTLERGVSDG